MKEDTGSNFHVPLQHKLTHQRSPGGCKSPGFAHGGALELLGGGGGGSPAPGGNVTGVLISGLGAGGSGLVLAWGRSCPGWGPGDGGRPEDGAGPGGGGRS